MATAETTKARVLATPGFIREGEEKGAPDMVMLTRLLTGPKGPESEPSMIVGDPACKGGDFEDDGRTLRIPGKFKFYAKRDDYPEGPVVTFLLPSEY